MRLFFFDNGPKPGKGKSQHVLKVRAYLVGKPEPLDQSDYDWERCIQLIKPKKVIDWAKAEHAQGAISEEVFQRYVAAARSCNDWETQANALWVKMGHMASKPGTVYFHDQFVAVRCSLNGSLSATLYLDGDVVEIKKFHPNTAARRINAPPLHALYDPLGLIDTRRSK